jgi:hypothetical protein
LVVTKRVKRVRVLVDDQIMGGSKTSSKRVRRKSLGGADGVIWVDRKGIPVPRWVLAAPAVSKETAHSSQG